MDENLSVGQLAAGTRIVIVTPQRSATKLVLRLIFVTLKRLALGVLAILL